MNSKNECLQQRTHLHHHQYLDIYSAIEYLNMCVNNNFCLINQINQKLSYLDNKINVVNEKVELIKLQNGLK